MLLGPWHHRGVGSPDVDLEKDLIAAVRAAAATQEELRRQVSELDEQLTLAARSRGVAEHALLVRIRDLEEERDHWKQVCDMITGSRGYRLLEFARRSGLRHLSRR